jgi:REP element-mobilizing transposase RayT
VVNRPGFPEISAEGALWEAAAATWEGVSGLARQEECEIEEGHLRVDHVHMLIQIPPKYAVSQVVGI